VLSATHFPAEQLPLQQSPFALHAALSELQIVPPHLPPVHVTEQHSEFVMHAAPAGEHCPTLAVQSFDAESHVPEQQSLPLEHDFP
jgi:hypothetical protein